MKLPTPFVIPIIAETDEQLAERKELFATLLLKDPANPFKVALIIYPDDTSQALKVANTWPKDPEVIMLQKSLLESDEKLNFLPDKFESCQLAYSMAKNENAIMIDRIKALELYMKAMQHIPKEAANTINNTVVSNRVMIVKDHGTNEDWEKKLINNQRALVNADYSKLN